ncbi:MAG: hypothetical protein JKY91_02630 [Emcibacter sp.]|nr:hypothetical protein [Emcibacter sp.]MBL4893893.1 hypothetical protein [Emcibacter sp.]
MIKVVVGFFVLMVMISAGTVFSLKETTERLEARKQQLSSLILKDRSAIKVLRAEMAYLSQPERLQKLSRRFLALSPSRPDQMADSVNAIASREDFQMARMPADAFPLLLPQEKPAFQKKKYQQREFKAPVVLVSYPVVKKQPLKKVRVQKVRAKKVDFYERISLKLGEGE